MPSSRTIKISVVAASLAALAFVGVRYVAHDVPQAHAASSGVPVTGYAWSQYLGWIHFDGSNYGVYESPTGVLSGYAWSPYFGWLDFSSASVNLASGKISGVVPTFENGGVWSGEVHLSGTAQDRTTYGFVQKPDCTWSGYAWGGPSGVGGIHASGSGYGVSVPGGSAKTLSASPATVAAGETATLTWTSTNATECTIDNGVATGGRTSGSVSVTPVTTTTYALTCTPVAGSFACGSATTTVTVNSNGLACTRSGNNFTATPGLGSYHWTVDGVVSSVTTNSVPVPTADGSHSASVSAGGVSANCPLVTIGGNGGSGSCVVNPTGKITSSPNRVSSSSTHVKLSWSVSGYNTLTEFTSANCKIIVNGTTNIPLNDASVDSCNASGVEDVTGITNQTVYSLSCGGNELAHAVVNVSPRFNEF